MKKVFFDTSAFVKRYVNESGSQRVIEICQQAELCRLASDGGQEKDLTHPT